MHVLIVPSSYSSPDCPVGGIFFREQAKALMRAGLHIGIVYPEARSLRTFSLGGVHESHYQFTSREEDGIPTFRVHGWSVPPGRIGWSLIGRRLWVWQAIRLIDQYINRYGAPDLIHAHCVGWGGYAAMRAAAKLKIPFLITEHSSYLMNGAIPTWESSLYHGAFQRAQAVIAVSSVLRDSLMPYVQNARNIEVIPNLVNTDFFVPPHRASDNGSHRVLCVCNLLRSKGVDVLMRAFSDVLREIPDACLEIGGDGSQRAELEALSQSLGLKPRVRFLGFLTQPKVVEAMQRANLFVLPSYLETFGVVLIEAMATGLPVVATECGGPQDFVTPEVGALVQPGDSTALGAAISRMLNGESMYNGDFIRSYCVSHFSASAISDRLIKLYTSII